MRRFYRSLNLITFFRNSLFDCFNSCEMCPYVCQRLFEGWNWMLTSIFCRSSNPSIRLFICTFALKSMSITYIDICVFIRIYLHILQVYTSIYVCISLYTCICIHVSLYLSINLDAGTPTHARRNSYMHMQLIHFTTLKTTHV